MSPAYLVVTSWLVVAALWMMTATGNTRRIKLCCAVLAAGAIVDVFGLARAMLDGSAYATIWPGELVLNAGVTLLMCEWIRLDRRQRARRVARDPDA
ncbi:hypothetical protein [Luteimonas abyssi]|uniref:hypothetical protein n=1 Tax=Luteimonas abyssi TaxID=1247514 RepID=UPI000737C1FC|nr:hypothetical protein [Luteimonas abyssi]